MMLGEVLVIEFGATLGMELGLILGTQQRQREREDGRLID
jgi:hypothetical protein